VRHDAGRDAPLYEPPGRPEAARAYHYHVGAPFLGMVAALDSPAPAQEPLGVYAV